MISLDIDKPRADTRVVVAMSGGVDSAVTAALVAEAGYAAVGVTLQLYDDGAAAARKGACCAGQDIYDARRVADAIGIPHYVLDYRARFRESVIEPFVDSYVAGETPIPCVTCNRTVKFRDLMGLARDLGADALATGHYVRRLPGPDGAELHRAVDADRDQSYFLFATTRDQLDYLRFPAWRDDQGRGPQGKQPASLCRWRPSRTARTSVSCPMAAMPASSSASDPARQSPARSSTSKGGASASHDGTVNFTVGQRRGLKVGGAGEPLYVIRTEPEARRVVVGPRAALARSEIAVGGLNWLGGAAPPSRPVAVQAKIRSMRPPASATLRAAPDGTATVALEAPEHGVAPGQACVLYDGERVLGGGWIRRTAAAVPP